MSPQPRILMCPPDYYAIEYEINAWMNLDRQCDHDLAVTQWRDLRTMLEAVGASIECLTPTPGLPDLVFTANAAFIYGSRAVIARFRHNERQREATVNEQWFRAAGFAVEHVHESVNFEGAGDALFCGDTLFAGYRIRSDARGHQQLGASLGVRVIPLELIDPYYYHLDTCFCPLSPELAIYYPPAFDDYGRQVLEELVPELIPVGDQEARRFACNAVVVGRHVVTNTGCPVLHLRLQEHGFSAHETPLDEFVKAGGSAKCLTLRLDGEDAASWRYQTQTSNSAQS